MGPTPPCPALQNYTWNILIIIFSPSVNALLAVGLNINSSEEILEGSNGLPLTLVRHDAVKTRTPRISSREIIS